MIGQLRLRSGHAGLLLGLLVACQAQEIQAPGSGETGRPQFASITGYSLNDISPPNAIDAVAYAISDRGWIAGTALDAVQSYAWVRTSSGSYRMLGTLPGYPRAIPEAVNNNGDVVGELWTASGSASIAVFWPFNSPPVQVFVPSLYPILGSGLNDRQEVVGTALTSLVPPLAFHAYVWTYNHQQGTDLGTMGGTDARATAINAAGDIAGWLSLTSTMRRAFIKPVGQNAQQLVYGTNVDAVAVGVTDLGAVMTAEDNGGSVTGIEWTPSYTIAEKWQTQGSIEDVNRNASAVIYNALPAVHFSHGSTVALPGLPAGLGHAGLELNASEWVVGSARNSAGYERAILWLPYKSRD